MTKAVAVAFSMAWREAGAGGGGEADVARELLAGFRWELYRCLTARADALFELADAVLCADGPVRTLAGLSLAPEHQRGHGALYDAVNCGRIQVARLRRALAGLPLPTWPDGRIRLGVDVSPWLRPGAVTSPDRLFCHVYGRGKGQAQMIPGWLGRLRIDRVLQRPAPPRPPGTLGRPRKHGVELALADPATWPAPQVTTSTATSRYGTAAASAWDRVHPRLTHRAAWLNRPEDPRPRRRGPVDLADHRRPRPAPPGPPAR
jgi:hypothetical protein